MESRLPRTVLLLGVVSLLTDLSGEMIYPLLPVFLAAKLGATALALGLIEGVAESTASLLKLVSGKWSDRTPRRKGFLVAGYGLAGACRPLIGLAWAWPVVLVLRFLDRVGKGIRSAPRDAMIADVTDPSLRGRAFGFHRAMDHAGAVLGPLVAAGLLLIPGVTTSQVFLLAAIPALVTFIVLVAGVRETPRVIEPVRTDRPPGTLPAPFRRLLLAVLVFTLGNSTDAFLLLRLSDGGLPAGGVAAAWSAHHVVKMGGTWFFGRLSDRVPRRTLIAVGWLIYAAVYATFSLPLPMPALLATFLVYGLYFGLVEPAEKAWVADLVPPELRGSAFGAYHAAIGIAALPASLLFGFLWQRFGMPTAFLTGAAFALAAIPLLFRSIKH